MIAFDLICSQGHKFEGWFKNNHSFEEQNSYGVIFCPVCNDNRIEKAFSTFAIRKSKSREETREDTRPEKTDERNVSLQALQMISKYVEKNFEDVGLNFAREALKIHFGEAEKRNIKGTALPDEEKILQEEGVPFLKIPIIKTLDN